MNQTATRIVLSALLLVLLLPSPKVCAFELVPVDAGRGPVGLYVPDANTPGDPMPLLDGQMGATYHIVTLEVVD